MRETGRRGLENTCKKWARKHGWFVHKFRSPGHNASPDDVFIKSGRVLWVEFKAPGAQPTDLQSIVIRNMLSVGADVVWLDDEEDFKAVLENRVSS